MHKALLSFGANESEPAGVRPLTAAMYVTDGPTHTDGNK